MSRNEKTRVSRRTLLAGIATTVAATQARAQAETPAAAPSAAAPGAAAPKGSRKGTGSATWHKVRRVVTSEDEHGRGVLLFDGEPTNSRELNGTRITRLWETEAVPAELPLRADAGATAGNAYREGFRGTSFYLAELPGGSRAPRIPMHKNATVDYMAILSGRVVLAIDGREIELRTGDTIVQGGNDHTWINRWREPCLLLFVVVTAARGGSEHKIA